MSLARAPERGRGLREPWKTLVAIGSALFVAMLLTVVWFFVGLFLPVAVADSINPIGFADPAVLEFFFALTLLFFPYSFFFVPVVLAFLFHGAISSGDPWGALRSKRRLYIALFVVGLLLGMSISLSGSLTA